MTFRRLLVPVDFSPSSDHALAEAVRLAEQLDARLWILNVVEIPLLGWPVYGREFSPEALTQRDDERVAEADRIAVPDCVRQVVLPDHAGGRAKQARVVGIPHAPPDDRATARGPSSDCRPALAGRSIANVR